MCRLLGYVIQFAIAVTLKMMNSMYHILEQSECIPNSVYDISPNGIMINEYIGDFLLVTHAL